MNNPMAPGTFVVTGSTSGIGLAATRLLLLQRHSVIGVARSPERCRHQEEQLAEFVAPGACLKMLAADLSLQSDILQVAQRIRQTLDEWKRPYLDGLINNAATVPFWQTFTPEGFDLQWAVNHLAPFLLTIQLLPLLKAAPRARVVTVSSASHYNSKLNWEDIQLRRHYNPLRAYGQTKLANVLFTLELDRRLRGASSVRAFAADPGLVNTELGLKSNSFLARWAWDLRRRGGQTPEEFGEGHCVPRHRTIHSACGCLVLEAWAPEGAQQLRTEPGGGCTALEALRADVRRGRLRRCSMAENSATRRLILEAVVACIEKYGIDKLTTRKIAVEAGTNIASINYHFRSKDELLAEALSMTIKHMMEDVFVAIDDVQQSFEITLGNVIFYLLDGSRQFPGVSRAHLYKAVVQRDRESVSAQAIVKVFDRLVQRAVHEYPAKDPRMLRLALAQILSSIMFTLLSPDFFPLPREYQLRSPKSARALAEAYTREFEAMM